MSKIEVEDTYSVKRLIEIQISMTKSHTKRIEADTIDTSGYYQDDSDGKWYVHEQPKSGIWSRVRFGPIEVSAPDVAKAKFAERCADQIQKNDDRIKFLEQCMVFWMSRSDEDKAKIKASRLRYFCAEVLLGYNDIKKFEDGIDFILSQYSVNFWEVKHGTKKRIYGDDKTFFEVQS